MTVAHRCVLARYVLALTFGLAACHPQPSAETARGLESPQGPPLRFAYQAIDGRPISSDALANRVSVIGFLTTYDLPSQIEARYLAMLERHHAPRVNVAALMLEAPEDRPLVEAFATSLGLGYPIALADSATIAGEGPFAGLHHVPSIVVLDRQGRDAWHHVGLVDEAALEAVLRAVEGPSRKTEDHP